MSIMKQNISILTQKKTKRNLSKLKDQILPASINQKTIL